MLSAGEFLDLRDRIAAQSDQKAFARLYMGIQPYLRQFAMAIIRNHELAEEIVSDVFIRIWQNRQKLSTVENLKLYLYVSTRNTALNYASRHLRKDTVSLDEMQVTLNATPATPEQLLITSEALRKVESEIQKLPARCRLIFKLVREDGLKYKDIASLLDISVKTIDNQMAIALKKIRMALQCNLEKKNS